jgi:serine-type D-Ala-D-Ala carboxypeptidase (penicillin-binding protein 5/6)
MKHVLLFLIALLSPVPVLAQQAEQPAPVLAAKSWLLLDYDSDQILANNNGQARIEPASLTKLMTVYLSFAALRQGNLKPEQTITPSEDALRPEGEESRMFLDTRVPVTVMELLHGLIIQSGNDAARVLAETIGGSEASFVSLMNKEAQRLGMRDTHFVNATGMPDPQHYSSAYDLALLSAAIIRDFPEYYPLFSLREYQYNNIKQANRNLLLWMDPYVDGIKTGHTESAGFCLVASAMREKHRLISVVIGATSEHLRAIESQKLLNYGFQNFEAVRLYQKNQAVTSLRVWKGTEDQINIGFRKDLFLSVPTGQLKQLKASIETRQPIVAPVSAGQQIGTLKLELNGKPYSAFPLVALDSVSLANVFLRGWDNIRLLFQ